MPGIEKLLLEDAFEDSPQTRSLLGVFEEDAMKLKKYSQGLQVCCQRVLNAQRELSSATQSLSSHLKAYEIQRFCLESEDSILSQTLRQFTGYLDELSSVHAVLTTQLGDSMMYPLNKFLQADLDEISTMCEMYQISSHEHEQAIARYMKYPKKKDNDAKLRHETSEDLYVYRKKFHQTSLHYYSALNALQYKRKTALLEPLIGYVHAVRAFYGMGRDVVAKPDIDDFLSNISASVQGVHRELGQETQKTVGQIENLEKCSQHLYNPQALQAQAPQTDLAQKAGFLYLRSKQALIASKWERCYFFIQGGNLMCQLKDEVAGSLILDLNSDDVKTEVADADDRRYVFHIVAPKLKKTVVLQAENECERDEWIFTLNNVMRRGGYVRGVAPKSKLKPAANGQSADSSQAKPGKKHVDFDLDGSMPPSGPPPTPPLTPSEGGFYPDAPIQFDIISPSEENREFPVGKDGPPKRINPFNESPAHIISDNKTDDSGFSQSFIVRFLGSMKVRTDRGESLVHETIRQIMAARAIHNVFKMTESHLVVSSTAMRLLDPSNNTIRTEFQLEDISYWAVHSENKRLFGFITRTKSQNEPTFACHVFECDASGEEICHAISAATKLAYEALLVKGESVAETIAKEEDLSQDDEVISQQKAIEKQILMENIHRMEEQAEPDGPRMSADGQHVILSDQSDTSSTAPVSPPSPESPELNPPITENRGDGDERKVEGAECESEA